MKIEVEREINGEHFVLTFATKSLRTHSIVSGNQSSVHSVLSGVADGLVTAIGNMREREKSQRCTS